MSAGVSTAGRRARRKVAVMPLLALKDNDMSTRRSALIPEVSEFPRQAEVQVISLGFWVKSRFVVVRKQLDHGKIEDQSTKNTL